MRKLLDNGWMVTIALGLSGIAQWAAAADEFTIVAFGDSTTAPRGTLRVYADILTAELPESGLPVRVINAGVGGNHTGAAAARFEQDVLRHDPDVVIIQFGINDAAIDVWKDPPATDPRVALAEYEQQLRRFVLVLKQRRTRVVLMTPNPLRWTPKLRALYGKAPFRPDDPDGLNLKLRDYAAAVRRVAREEGVALVDVYRRFEEFGATNGQSVDDLLLDGMHPNERGQRLVADQLMALLRNEGAPNCEVSRKPAASASDRL